jgi:hypothetical protein
MNREIQLGFAARGMTATGAHREGSTPGCVPAERGVTGNIKTILFILRIIDKEGRMLCTGAEAFIP